MPDIVVWICNRGLRLGGRVLSLREPARDVLHCSRLLYAGNEWTGGSEPPGGTGLSRSTHFHDRLSRRPSPIACARGWGSGLPVQTIQRRSLAKGNSFRRQTQRPE